MGRKPKLCPVCLCRYIDTYINDDADIVYIHGEFMQDGERHVHACIVTDNSVIRGVSMRPPDPPAAGRAGKKNT